MEDLTNQSAVVGFGVTFICAAKSHPMPSTHVQGAMIGIQRNPPQGPASTHQALKL